MTEELQTAIGQTVARNIDNLDYTISGMEETITNFLGNIENIEDFAIDVAQQKIDAMCERVSNEISDKFNEQLTKMVESINNLYDSSSAIQTAVSAITTFDLTKIDTITGVVIFLEKVKAMYTKPYDQAVKTIADFALIAVKLGNLITKINGLISIKDSIPIHKLKNGKTLNYNKLVLSISLSQLENLISKLAGENS